MLDYMSLDDNDSREVRVVKVRPDFGKRQIKDPKDLVVGRTYRVVQRRIGGRKFTLTRAPYQRPDDGKWMIDTDYDCMSGYLSDNGVVPYDNGYWNSTNHILETS